MKISLCMIVRDEEETLGRCLDSVCDLVDETVIVDTGSHDKTHEIASRYTDHLHRFPWIDDFSAARNYAFSKACGDYLFWMDADDVLPAPSRGNFPALRDLLEKEEPDVVMCPYDVGFDGSRPTASFFRERFLRRESNFFWQGRVHECIAPRGKIVKSDVRILHLGSNKNKEGRNLRIYQRWIREEPLSARDRFYYGRELYYSGLYTECVAVLEEMIGGDGWYVNKIDACRILALARERRGETDRAIDALLTSFRFGEPRAVILCELGRLFRALNKPREAAYWYEAALAARDHTEEGDFEEPACHSVTPLLELVCCYYELGDRDRALACHKRTEELAPDHPSVRYNREFFREH